MCLRTRSKYVLNTLLNPARLVRAVPFIAKNDVLILNFAHTSLRSKAQQVRVSALSAAISLLQSHATASALSRLVAPRPGWGVCTGAALPPHGLGICNPRQMQRGGCDTFQDGTKRY